MQIKRKIFPGQKDMKRSLNQNAAKIVCVRYRYDDQKRKQLKTIKLIIEGAP